MTDGYPSELRQMMDRFDPDWPEVLEVGPGWYPLLSKLDARLATVAPRYVLQQVKSKFGALRVYARPSDDPYEYVTDFNEAIEAAEWESIETCEECGAPARQYVISLWVWTVCDTHAQEKRVHASGHAAEPSEPTSPGAF